MADDMEERESSGDLIEHFRRVEGQYNRFLDDYQTRYGISATDDPDIDKRIRFKPGFWEDPRDPDKKPPEIDNLYNLEEAYRIRKGIYPWHDLDFLNTFSFVEEERGINPDDAVAAADQIVKEGWQNRLIHLPTELRKELSNVNPKKVLVISGVVASMVVGLIVGPSIYKNALQPTEVVSQQTPEKSTPQTSAGGLALAETPTPTPTQTATPKPTETPTFIPRPDGIAPEVWNKLSPQDKIRLTENTARIRGNADIEAGRVTPAPISPENSGVPPAIKIEDLERANKVAAKPPPPPPEASKPLIPETGIGWIDTSINFINNSWEVLKWAFGIGVAIAIWKLLPKIPKLAWEAIKLPFKGAAAVIRFINRLFRGGPPKGGTDDRDDYMTSGGS